MICSILVVVISCTQKQNITFINITEPENYTSYSRIEIPRDLRFSIVFQHSFEIPLIMSFYNYISTNAPKVDRISLTCDYRCFTISTPKTEIYIKETEIITNTNSNPIIYTNKGFSRVDYPPMLK